MSYDSGKKPKLPKFFLKVVSTLAEKKEY